MTKHHGLSRSRLPDNTAHDIPQEGVQEQEKGKQQHTSDDLKEWGEKHGSYGNPACSTLDVQHVGVELEN